MVNVYIEAASIFASRLKAEAILGRDLPIMTNEILKWLGMKQTKWYMPLTVVKTFVFEKVRERKRIQREGENGINIIGGSNDRRGEDIQGERDIYK